MYVFNADGELMYPYSEVSDETLAVAQFYQQSQSETASFVRVVNPITQEKELMTYAESSYSDFTFICVQTEATILAPVLAFTRLLLILAVVILLLVVWAS